MIFYWYAEFNACCHARSCPSDSGTPCILCKHSTKPKCSSGSRFAQQQFEKQQLTTPCDMLPHIDIKTLSEYNERVRVEVITEHSWPLGIHFQLSRPLANRNARSALAVAMQVSVVNGKEYISKCPVPWQTSDSRTDIKMRLDHQQLHINTYNRKSKTWTPEPQASMCVSPSKCESKCTYGAHPAGAQPACLHIGPCSKPDADKSLHDYQALVL